MAVCKRRGTGLLARQCAVVTVGDRRSIPISLIRPISPICSHTKMWACKVEVTDWRARRPVPRANQGFSRKSTEDDPNGTFVLEHNLSFPLCVRSIFRRKESGISRRYVLRWAEDLWPHFSFSRRSIRSGSDWSVWVFCRRVGDILRPIVTAKWSPTKGMTMSASLRLRHGQAVWATGALIMREV